MKKKKYLTIKGLEEGKNYHAFSPRGVPIKGTFDRLYAVATIASVRFDGIGNIYPEYLGESEIDWNSQSVEQEDGQDRYVDVNGNIWKANQLRFLEVKD